MVKPLQLNAQGTSHIYIYDDIDSFWGFSASQLQQELQSLPDNAPIVVHLNSMGGDVFQGLAIYNVLRSRENVTTIVEGIAASIASVIFLAGGKREMYEESWLMIHDPSIHASGTKQEVENMLELLEQAGQQVRQIYLKNSSINEDDLETHLSKDTYFTASEAIELGLATGTVSIPNATAKANIGSLVAKLSRSVDMKFETWLADYCKPLGLDASALSDEQKANLKLVYDAEQNLLPQNRGSQTPPVATPVVDPQLEARRKAADEEDRQNDIRDIASRFSDSQFNEDYLNKIGVTAKTIRGLTSHAIRQGWSSDQFELECRRAETPSIGHVGIHTATPEREAFSNTAAVSCALVRNAGVKAQGEHKVTKAQYGYEQVYDQRTLEASDHPSLRNTGLLHIMEQFYIQANGSRYSGRLNTDGFISACRDAMFKLRMDANTTWTGLNIFDDAANKMLWAAYQAMNTTWQEWVYTSSVSDFKTHNHYRMTIKGGYMKVGSDGRLKHGGLSDDKYTNSADTYGKMVGLSRRDLINDDLGALNRIMSALGIEGARFLEELFYGHFLAQQTTLFPTGGGNNNYISGAATALGVDGLTTGEKTFKNQVDSDGAPIMVDPEILLVGNTLSVPAAELFTNTQLQGVQSANAKKRPDGNPHAGKFRPVVSGYLDNTSLLQRTDALGAMGSAFSNQSATQWFLMPSPSNPFGGVVIGSFLNGVQTPTIDQADQAFDVLGLQWRAYHDAGADNGDPTLAVHSAGA